MKRFILFLVSFALFAQNAFSQNSSIYNLLEQKFGKGKVEYDKDCDVYEVRVENYYGVYDSKGKMLLPIEYNFIVPDFDRRGFVLGKQGKYGAALPNGKIVVPCQYSDISLHDGFIAAAKGAPVGKDSYGHDVYDQWGAFDLDGNEIVPFVYSQILHSCGDYIEVSRGHIAGVDNSESSYRDVVPQ